MKRLLFGIALFLLAVASPVAAQFCGQPGFCNVRGAASGPFTPASLSPSYWMEPRKGGMFQSIAGTTPATANGDVVGYLPDQSSNAILTSAAADNTTRPALTNTTGQLCIQFDGSNDILFSANGSSPGSYNAGSASWFVAFRSSGTTASAVIAGDFNNVAGNDFYSPIMSTATASTAGAGIRTFSGSAMVPLQTAIQTGVYNGANHVYGIIDSGTTLTPYLDGVAGTPVNYSVARAGSLAESRLSLGGRYAASSPTLFFPHINCGAVFVNRILTGTEITNLTTYMQGLF